MTIYWVNTSGTIKRATSDDGAAPSGNVVAVNVPPNPAPVSGKQKWDFNTNTWEAPPAIKPNRTARLIALKGTGASIDDLITILMD